MVPSAVDCKRIGDVSELRVAAKLMEMGLSVAAPFGDNDRYDLVVDTGECFERVQVKTARLQKLRSKERAAKVLEITCKYSGSGSSSYKAYSKKQIDCVIAYWPDEDRYFKLPVEMCSGGSVKLRLNPDEGAYYGGRKAEDYEM